MPRSTKQPKPPRSDDPAAWSEYLDRFQRSQKAAEPHLTYRLDATNAAPDSTGEDRPDDETVYLDYSAVTRADLGRPSRGVAYRFIGPASEVERIARTLSALHGRDFNLRLPRGLSREKSENIARAYVAVQSRYVTHVGRRSKRPQTKPLPGDRPTPDRDLLPLLARRFRVQVPAIRNIVRQVRAHLRRSRRSDPGTVER